MAARIYYMKTYFIPEIYSKYKELESREENEQAADNSGDDYAADIAKIWNDAREISRRITKELSAREHESRN